MPILPLRSIGDGLGSLYVDTETGLTYYKSNALTGALTLLGAAPAADEPFAIPYLDSAPADGTIVVIVRMPFGGTVDSMTVDLDSGTVTVAAKIGGVDITSLDAVAASSTKATTAASGANTFVEGDELSLTFSSASSPVNLRLTLNCTKSA